MKKLKKKNIEDILVLTPMQEGMLYHYLKSPGSDYYFEQLSLEISGEISKDVFEKAWNFVIETNEMLRTVFRWEKVENPVQIVLKRHTLHPAYYDLSSGTMNEKKKQLEKLKVEDRKNKFDLREVPFRIALCKVDEDKYEMVISNHHILYDGWSNGIILKEFFNAYNHLYSGRILVEPVKVKFKEWIKWIENQDRNTQEQFWGEYLEGFDTPTALPGKKIRDKAQGVESYSIILEEDIKVKLEVFGSNNRVTLASVLYCAWGILLQKYCSSNDVIFGTTVSGRSARIKGIEDTAGLFVNTIPLRVQAYPNEKISTPVFRIDRILREREAFENTPLVDIKSYSAVEGDESLFNTIVAIENYPLDSRLLMGNSLLFVNSYSIFEITHYDFNVGIMFFNEIEVKFAYNRELYDKETVENLARHFLGILQKVVENPEEEVSQLEIISKEEKNRILYDFNNTAAEYPEDKTIHQLFAEQAEKIGDSVAVVCGGQEAGGRTSHLTYGELNRKSNQLAHLLRKRGVGFDSIVGIMVERSVEMIIGILGILKAGGTYLPIDPDYPGGRIEYMLKDSKVRVLVSEGSEISKVSGGIDVVKIDELSELPPTHLTHPTHPTQLCYAIYTSGTTGKPKGTLIEHRSLVNYVNWFSGKAAITGKDRTVLTSSFSFDLGYTLIFSTLLNGCPFHILPVEIYRSPEDLIGYISTHGITYIKVTPSYFTAIIESPGFTPQSVRTLRFVVLGGEEVKAGDVEKAHAIGPHIAFMDEYGPTETTIGCAAYLVDFNDFDGYKKQPTIGNPINNMNAFILNEELGLLPPGIPGELCIAGIGASRGYLNRPGLTAEKFLFFSYKSYKSYRTYFSKKIYKTGDLARWLPNGSIEFLGRMDQQIKIRGFRIELGEIETQLRHYNDIKDAVVTALESERKRGKIVRKDDKYLCAYIVFNDDKQLSIGEIKQYLSSRLPDYMIPPYIMQIDRIPLTPNGKVDSKKLPKPEIRADKEYSPPRNHVEKKLVEIWQEVLGLDKEVSPGIDDNFFELGGHSLKVAGLLGRIHKAFDIKLSFSILFESPTIRGLSQHMRGTEGRLHHDILLAEEKEYYPLVPTQKRFYVFQQVNPADTSYNMTETMLFEGGLSGERLEAAFLQLLSRHESLRTSFYLLAGEPVQMFHREVKFSIEYYDLEKVNGAGHNKITGDFVRPFDLTQPPLWRVGLIKIASDKHFLIFDMHHLVADGTSIGIFIRDFNSIYNREYPPRLKIRFRDYVEWKTQEMKKSQGKSQEIFALEKLENELLNLPTDYPRPAAANYEGKTIRFDLGIKETRALYDFCLRRDVTLFMALLAVFSVLLSKLSGQETIAVGSPIAGRVHVDLDHLIGLFLNILCLRNRPSAPQRFSSFLREIKERLLFTFENQDYQYDELVELTDVARGSGRNPLFDVMLVLQNMEMPGINIPGLTTTREVGNYVTSKFDMTLYCEEKETLVFKLEYKTSLFKQETIQRFIRYFENIISQVLEDPHKPISNIGIITEEERRQILYDFNDTAREYPTGKTIHQLFEGQTEKSCDRAAVNGVEQLQVTYRELDKKAGQLARVLREKGVTPGTIVGIMIERSVELIIGIMGILKAGGVYLPIDTNYPQERINYIFKDSSAGILVSELSKVIEECEVVDVGVVNRLACSTTEDRLHLSPAPATSLAYVIYTSGSTGSPKGVMVEHSSVVNILSDLQDEYPLRESDTYLFKTSYIFDVSVAELFGWFLGGGRLIVLEAGGEKDPQKIIETVERQCVTHINFVPSMFAVFVEQLSRKNAGRLSGLRYIFLAGEALSGSLVERFNELGCRRIRLENLYGPTEGTIYASYYSLRQWDKQGSVPIGKPVGNVRLYILDKNRCLQPVGVPGELCISGLGVARGYLNNPGLTAEKFDQDLWDFHDYQDEKKKDNEKFWEVQEPFFKRVPGRRRLYKTGDLVRWLVGGNIEFLGRSDHQVKIRGFRIELGEIENRLLKHEDIHEAIVVCRGEESGDKYLCAYVVPRHPESFQGLELREYLSESLPDYMVPSYFVPLEKMPLNPSGKVDRRALPQPVVTGDVGYVPPENEVEAKLVELWAEILKLDKGEISIDDNFFNLGGHSLKAAGLAGRIHKEFSIEISMTELFKKFTVKDIAHYIRASRETLYSSIKPIEERDYYELSAAQERLFALQRMAPDTLTYNISGVMELEGKLDSRHFKESVKKLIKRRESLRTSFEIIDGTPVQRVYQDVECEVEYFDLATEEKAKIQNSKFKIQNSFIRPFDLSQAPLLRVGLIKIGEEKHILTVDMHHIISDGMSMNIFVNEFGVLYTGKEQPELQVQYKDFALWQKRLFTSPAIGKQGAYWQEQFEGEVPVLNLPYDYPRPLVREFAGERREFDTGKDETGKLKKLALEKGTTPFTVLLAIFNLFISRLSNQEDIVVGIPTAGRNHPDTEGIFGMFVNTLPFRTHVAEHKRFTEFLDDIGKGFLSASENQDYPYEELVEDISLARDLSRNPLYDVVFVLQNTGMERVEIPGLKSIPCEYESHTAKFDLTLQCIEINDNLRFTLEYSTALFNEATIDRFTRYFCQLLSNVLEDTEKSLWEPEIIPGDEKRQLLVDFNNTAAEYPRHKTIHELFEEQMARTPDRSAVVKANISITYRELNETSNQLAWRLRKKGVKPGSITAVMIDTCPEMIIGVLGILKAGGTYLPLAPDYPVERKKFMVKDCGAGVLVSKLSESSKLSEGIDVVIIDDLSEHHPTHPTHPTHLTHLTHLTHPTNLCYIIYTSGSTGRPKGIPVTHRSLVNLCCWHNDYYSVTSTDRASKYAGFGFDASVWEIFPYLIAGAALCLVPDEIKLDIAKLNDYFETNEITIGFLPTHVCEQFMKYENSSLRVLLTGGDKLKEYTRRNYRLENNYGPTENTVVTTSYPVESQSGNIPIGKPTANTRLYILNNRHRLQPMGVPGELCISSEGLSPGYLNTPELTAEKFINVTEQASLFPTPHSPTHPLTHSTIYRTGDLARWLPDGNLEFLGRMDDQVKIRGFRIETGEIENYLSEHPEIDKAVVIAVDKDNDKHLCAYITASGELPAPELRDYLSVGLPAYMIPSYFMLVDEIPLTPNGKLDHRALPLPDAELTAEYGAPRNRQEEILVSLWGELLGIEKERIGIDDNFFQLGGHSLKATLLTAKIHQAFSLEVSIPEFFKNPTIRGISHYMEEAGVSLYALVEPVEKKEYYPLSSAQNRLYLLQQMALDGTGYNIHSAFEVEGQLDKERLEKTFRQVIKRHESLRTSFHMIEGEPVQRVHDEAAFEIECYDRELPTADCRLPTVFTFVRPFDLSTVPLLRVGLVRIDDEKHILIVDMHHIISDGTSMGLLVNYFTDLYGREELPVLRIQYKDFAAWQNSEKESASLKAQEEYWLKEFGGEIPVLTLPTDYARPAVQGFEGAALEFEISGGEKEAIKTAALDEGVTLYMMLSAVYTILLSKLSGQEEIVVGTPVAGRRHTNLEQMIGVFINTLPLKTSPSGEKSFRVFLQEIKEKALRAFENQDYQYEELIERLEVERDASRSPLFDVMFVFQNTDSTEIEIPGLKLVPYRYQTDTSKFDMLLAGMEEDSRIAFTLEYSTNLFKQDTIRRFITYFERLASSVVENSNRRMWEIEVLPEEEKREILYDFNDTVREYPTGKTIHQLFKEQTEKSCDSVAVIGQSTGARCSRSTLMDQVSITYKELNKESGRLAYLLRQKGVSSDANPIVGIMMERSIELIIGIMGILKAGGAYLPIDPNYPQERINYIFKDSSAGILVSELSKVSEECEVVDVSVGNRLACSTTEDRLHLSPAPATSLAYIIYTSGSTGKPKGVMVEHGSVINRLHWMQRAYPIGEKDLILQKTPTIFDVSVWELFWWSFQGASLYLLGPGEEKNPESIASAIEYQGVTTLHFVPSMLTAFLDHVENTGKVKALDSIRQVFSSGEALGVRQVKRFNRLLYVTNNSRLINLYGPTEATVDVSYFDCDLAEEAVPGSIPIGKPIDNIQLLILDNYLKIQPIGIAGELGIAGKGVARGYLNRPELTAEKFAPVFYRSYRTNRTYSLYFSKKIYKTGDSARLLVDGNIEFLGRIDHQVKIRGFRIELGEIENQLLKHEDIHEVVVVCRGEESRDKYLCAYVVPCHPESFQGEDLREYLLEGLPDYMVPSYFVPLERMPLNPNGKVDRRVLPEPKLTTGVGYAPPENEIEAKLVELWSEILNLDKGTIGVQDNFFRLGGHSLKAVGLASRIEKEFSVEISILEIFKKPTIKGTAGYIRGSGETLYSSIEPVEKREYYALSSAQSRLYILQQMALDGTGYNIPAAFEVEGRVEREKLEATFQQLVKRHESLRTSFHIVNGEPVQRVHEEVRFKIEYFSVEQKELDEELCVLGSKPHAVIKDFIRPFDLFCVPLLRVGLIKIEEEKHILLLDMHHIISDGISTGVLSEDFMTVYNGEQLPAFRIHYNDFSEWQNNKKQKELINQQEDYWLRELNGELPVLDLPGDYRRPQVQSFAGSILEFGIESSEARGLKTYALEENTTLYMVLLTIYNILLCKLTGQEDIIVGSPVAGRRHADLDHIIGVFINTLALRNFPGGEKSFNQFFREVKQRTLQAFANQDYPYEELVEKVSIERDTGRNPLFDTLFGLQNFDISEIEIPGLKLRPYDYETDVSKFDLSIQGWESHENIWFTMEYSTKLFNKKTIQRFINYFKAIISQVVKKNERKISEIEIISEKEKRQILFDFNRGRGEYPQGKTLHGLFEEQCSRSSNRIAVVGRRVGTAFPPLESKTDNPDYEYHLTYRELNERADELSHLLLSKGVRCNDIIGLMVERSIEMIIGIMGIMKAGAAYMPIDPEYPQERINYMLEDSNATLLLTSDELSDVGKGTAFCAPATCHLHLSLAYIIYTSGTTGKPKGVLVEHRSVVTYLNAFEMEFDLQPGDTVIQQASYTFDAFVEEIYPILKKGGKLAIPRREEVIDIELLSGFILKHHVTIITCSPLMLNELNSLDKIDIGSIRTFISGGDVLRGEYIDNLLAIGKVYNTYGPTEGTVCAAYYNCEQGIGPDVPIGKPISNYNVYILDKHKHLLPVNIPGELCISGIGVSRGYLNRIDLTAERYISNPFVEGERLYKTGDLARWLPDGNIEFLGRMDFQVKIRGFRIELGEIENCLLTHDKIKEAEVIVRKKTRQDKYLCAYIVAEEDLDMSELRHFLSRQLPDYMIPSHFVGIEKIPLTPNGKIDRKALPAPEIKVREDLIKPGNAFEEKLAELWSEILGIEKDIIGIDTNFFELGGHSLKAAILTAKIHKELDVKVPLAKIFKIPTIRGLVEYVKASKVDKYGFLQPVEKKEYYVLSSAQKRLYIVQQLAPNSTEYNMPTTCLIEGKIDREKLERAFYKLVQRHESLRTSFPLIRGEAVQRIHDDWDFKAYYYRCAETASKKILKELIKPFDLSQAPLLRTALIQIEEDKYFVYIDMHHIISDGTAMEILIRELVDLYEGRELKPLSIQYKDYVEWEHESLNEKRLKEQEKYWLEKMAGFRFTQLPVDKSNCYYTIRGEREYLEIGKSLYNKIEKFCNKYEITKFIFMITVFQIILAREIEQKDITIGIPASIRDHFDLKDLIGIFLNVLLIRFVIDNEDTFLNNLLREKETIIEALNNRCYPYELLAQRIKENNNFNGDELFSILFNYLPAGESNKILTNEFKIIPNDFLEDSPKYDITLYISDARDGMILNLVYKSNIYNKYTIEGILDDYIRLIELVLENESVILGDFSLSNVNHFEGLAPEFEEYYDNDEFIF